VIFAAYVDVQAGSLHDGSEAMNHKTSSPPIVPPPIELLVESPDGVNSSLGYREASHSQEMSGLSDADLLDGWRRDRSRPAFDELVRRYRVMVLSVCRRHCHTDPDAEDAFQTTWVCLAKSAAQIRQPDRLAGWLHRVATRASHLANQTRHGSPPRHGNTSTRDRLEKEPIEMHEIPADQDDPFVELTRRHEAIVLDEELAELPSHYRAAIVMHLIDGLDYQTIASRLQSTVGAVRGHVQRGKARLAIRLRRRGIVPVMAYAAIHTLRCSDAAAAEIAATTIPPGVDPSTLDPAIGVDATNTPVDLTSLLSSGNTAMRITSWVAAGLVATTAAVGLWMATIPAQAQTGERPLAVQLSEIPSEETGRVPVVISQLGPMENNSEEKVSANPTAAATNPPQPTPAEKPVAAPEYRTDIAREVAERMDEEIILNFTTSLGTLTEYLSAYLEMPVLLNSRAVAMSEDWKEDANLDVSNQTPLPLRTALRKMLQPLGLRAEIQDEGLVITADFTELTRRGISTDKWVGISDEEAEKIDAALDIKVAVNFRDIPLNQAMASLAESAQFPIRIDRAAIEANGLTDDTPVSASTGTLKAPEPVQADDNPAEEPAAEPDPKPSPREDDPFGKGQDPFSNARIPWPSVSAAQPDGVPLRNVLKIILHDLQLTYTVRDGMIVVTTLEAADKQLRSRIYFLEGTGFPRGDPGSAMMLLQGTLSPTSWEALGGVGTMMPVGNGIDGRPALVVSTTTVVHEQVEAMLKAFRETHFGPDPIAPRPASPAMMGGGGGGGGGGFGAGMGGMGGGFGGGGGGMF